MLRADYADAGDIEASAYEQLLLDVLEGDHTPFLRFDEVEWSWRIVAADARRVEDGRARGLRRRAATDRRASTASSGRATAWRPLVPPD